MTAEPLSGLDSVFVTMDAANAPLHIGVVLELEPQGETPTEPAIRFAEIRSTIEQRLSSIAILRRRVLRVPFDLGPPILVDDPEFDIGFHVVRRAVPSPGGTDELNDVVARVMAQPLAPDRPLWEISVIEGLAGGGTALLAKVHHALADGVSGVSVFAGLFDLGPTRDHTGRGAESGERGEVPPLPTPVEMLARSSSEILRRPGAFLEMLGTSLERLAGKVDAMVGATAPEGSREGGLGSLLDAPRTTLSGTVSYARNFERFRLTLETVKCVTHKHGATVTDFAEAMVGGALRKLLDARGEVVERDLVAFVPVSLRAPGREGDLGNQISGRLVPLCTEIISPIERLAMIAERNEAYRGAAEDPGDVLNEVADVAGPALASLAGQIINAFDLFEVLPNIANVIISSVLGPPMPLWCSGERIVRASPMGPLMFNQALNVTMLGYGDALEFGVLACARKIPDADLLRALLEQEAALLLEGA